MHTSARPQARRKVKTEATTPAPSDGLTQTRIQPERSARTAVQSDNTEQQPKKAEPPEFPDLVMREWPHDGRTEVIITRGDFYRLEEAEYLNDTLIEFGLKHHWFAMPGESNGTTQAFTRDDIHIFNSFFYKKLSVRNKPGYKEANPNGPSWPAYETVRKWTNKVDVFSKKMLIIPINENLHWYLAIIINPGAILQKSGAKAPSSGTMQIVDLEKLAAKKEEKDELLAQQLLEEKAREEVTRKQAMSNSKPKEDENSQDPIDLIGSPHIPDNAPNDEDAEVEVEELPNQDSEGETTQGGRSKGQNQRPVPIPPPSQPIALTPPPQYVPQEAVKSTRRGPIVPPPPKLRTDFAPDEPVIMSFDSLGATHPTVGKILNKWLVYEAIDKKAQTQLTDVDWDTHFPAAYKSVRVPGQDNFADCGLYVLHYAIQLMKDLGELREYIFEQGIVKSGSEKEKNKDIWDAKDMLKKREEWKKMIQDLPSGKSGSKNEEGRKVDAVKENPSAETGAAGPCGIQLEGKQTAEPSTGPPGIKEQVVAVSGQPQPLSSNPTLLSNEGSLPRLTTPPLTSPVKRAISISPIASQDAPINKRRKIVHDHPSAQDVVADSEPEEDSVRLPTESWAHTHQMQVDEPLNVPPPRQSASPPRGQILAMESPEMTNDFPLDPSTMSALAEDLSEVKVTESSVSNPRGPSGRPSMESPTTHRPVTSRTDAGMTSATNTMTMAIKSGKKETPRERLRNDTNAEPMRSPTCQGSPAFKQKPSKKSGKVTAMADCPKLSAEEVEREAALDFSVQGSLATLEWNSLTQFRDTMVQPFRIAQDAGDTQMLEKLQRHIKRHVSGTDVDGGRLEPGAFDLM